jgi:hypothetical protein
MTRWSWFRLSVLAGCVILVVLALLQIFGFQLLPLDGPAEQAQAGLRDTAFSSLRLLVD